MQIKWDSFPFLMIDVLCEEENPNIWAQDYVWIPLLAALKCVLRWFQYPIQTLISKTNSYFSPTEVSRYITIQRHVNLYKFITLL